MKSLKAKSILILVLIIFLVLTGCGGCAYWRLILENDGMLTYVYNEKSDRYSLAGQVNLDLPEIVYVPFLFKGKEVVSLGHTRARMLSYGTRLPLLNGVDKIYYPYTMSRVNLDGGRYWYKSFLTKRKIKESTMV